MQVEQSSGGEHGMSWDMLSQHAEEADPRLVAAQYSLLGAVMRPEDMPDPATFADIFAKMLVNTLPLRSDRYYCIMEIFVNVE